MADEDVERKRSSAKPGSEAHRSLRRDHPLEEPHKNYHTVLEQQLQEAETELNRPALALFLSALAAGLDLGFGPFAMAATTSLLEGVIAPPLIDLLNANIYTLGFILVIFGSSELFTEHTTAAVQPVLAGRASMRQLFRLWSIVLAANLLGATAVAAFAATLGPAAGIVDPAAFGALARKLVDDRWWVMLMSAIGAGWVMGLLTWLVAAARDTISQIFFVWATTMIIGLLGLHHSIAGSIEVLMGVFSGSGTTAAQYARFLVLAVAGNAIGGVAFVALLKYSHVRQSVQG